MGMNLQFPHQVECHLCRRNVGVLPSDRYGKHRLRSGAGMSNVAWCRASLPPIPIGPMFKAMHDQHAATERHLAIMEKRLAKVAKAQFTALLQKLHAVIDEDSAEAEAIREAMEDPWYDMEEEDQAASRKLSGELNAKRDENEKKRVVANGLGLGDLRVHFGTMPEE